MTASNYLYTYFSYGKNGIRRWEDVDYSTIETYKIAHNNGETIILDMKDDLMLLYDLSNKCIVMVKSPNQILWIRHFKFDFSYYINGYINTYNNRSAIIVSDYDDKTPLLSIFDLDTGELKNTIYYPEGVYVGTHLSSYGYTKVWGHYIISTLNFSDFNADDAIEYIWVYNMAFDTFIYRDMRESKLSALDYTWNLLPPNICEPECDSNSSICYVILYANYSTITYLASIDLNTLEYIDLNRLVDDTVSGDRVGVVTGLNDVKVLFNKFGSNFHHIWNLYKFYGLSNISNEVVWDDKSFIIDDVKFIRSRGISQDIWCSVKTDTGQWIQKLDHNLNKNGLALLEKSSEETHKLYNPDRIFTSYYLFEGNLNSNVNLTFKLIDIIDNNQYVFNLIEYDEYNNYNFNILSVSWDGIELSFSHDNNTLIIYRNDTWVDYAEYICDIKINWINSDNDSNFYDYGEAILQTVENIGDFVDANGDGEHDYDMDIIVPDEYYDTTNLKPYIERRYRDAKTTSTLYNYYDIRIANPVEGGTPWYNLKPTSDVLKVNWRVRYGGTTGDIVWTGRAITSVTNDGWTITGKIYVGINVSYLDSSNRATIVLEVQTPTGEWIASDKFQINNYTNEYNYKWRFTGEDSNYIYFTLDGDYTAASGGWYKPSVTWLYDGEERLTTSLSTSTYIEGSDAKLKISKSNDYISKFPNVGYWFHFRGSDYTLSSAPKGFGGIEKCDFTIPLGIETTNVGQIAYEVTQLNSGIYVSGKYEVDNIVVYKDGVKLEGSYDKESYEIKFILPSDTPKEIKGYTLNLQYKVFYNDNDEIKSFIQDFTYTTYASYFVEFDLDFKDYYWEKIYSYPPTDDNYTLSNGTFAYHNGHLYLTGSYYFDGGYQKKLYRYTIENDKWIELTGPSYDTFKTHPVVYDNKIYYIGGITYSNYEYLSKVQIYDIESDTWSYGTDCPRNQGPREFQPILYNNKIYCFSGYCNDYPSPKSLMHIYDIESDSWETIDTPYSLRNYSATCIDGKIYICDGADSSYNYITTLYVYDIEANEWTTGPDKPVYPYGGQADGGTMLNKFVSILGYPGESIKTMSFVYDIQKDKWMRLPNAPTDLEYTYDYPLCVTDDSEVYVMKYQHFYRLTKPKVTYSDAYLYEYEGKYYTENENGELIETTTQELTDDLFAIEGVSYINSDLIKPNTKVLYFKVENKNEVPQLKYSGVYEGTTIIMDWDLQSKQGKTFNVLGDIYSDDNVRFLLSNDNGQTWKTFDGYEVVNCDIDNIKSNGMTYDIFTSLNASQLESFKGGTNSLRIAIYIEQYSVNGKTNIDHIRLRY